MTHQYKLYVTGMGHVLAEIDDDLYDRLHERAFVQRRLLRDVILDALRAAVEDPPPPELALKVAAFRAGLRLADPGERPRLTDHGPPGLMEPVPVGAGGILALVDNDREDPRR